MLYLELYVEFTLPKATLKTALGHTVRSNTVQHLSGKTGKANTKRLYITALPEQEAWIITKLAQKKYPCLTLLSDF